LISHQRAGNNHRTSYEKDLDRISLKTKGKKRGKRYIFEIKPWEIILRKRV